MATFSMTDTNARLRQARESAGFSSARSAALRFGWIPSTYASHENGQIPVPTKEAPKYARAFKVSAAWLLTGEGQQKSRNIVKVIGFIGAGAEITPPENQQRAALTHCVGILASPSPTVLVSTVRRRAGLAKVSL